MNKINWNKWSIGDLRIQLNAIEFLRHVMQLPGVVDKKVADDAEKLFGIIATDVINSMNDCVVPTKRFRVDIRQRKVMEVDARDEAEANAIAMKNLIADEQVDPSSIKPIVSEVK